MLMSRHSIISEESTVSSSNSSLAGPKNEFAHESRRFSPPTAAAEHADEQQRKIHPATDGPRRKSNPMAFASPPVSNARLSEQKCVERCVVVARQPDGYGLSVNGEYPVKVADVKCGGAAFLAGVRIDDRILKVNGMPVTAQNFQEVVKMISGGFNLVLTLFGPTRAHNSDGGWDDALFPVVHVQAKASTPVEVPANAAVYGPPTWAKRAEPNAPNWRQHSMGQLSQMLQQERDSLEAIRALNEGIGCGAGGGTKLERALSRISHLEQKLHLLSLLNSAQHNSNSPAIGARAKRGSLGEESHATDRQSSKTFPPSALRVSAAPAPTATRVEPIRSWLPIGDEEDDENSELGDYEEASGPFANLQELKTRQEHLAVFLVYLLDHGNPNSILFYLITDAYPSSNVKEMRRFAYELFSTFLIPGAPLQLANISQRDIQAIDKVLRSTTAYGSSPPQDAIDQLKKLFIPARTRAVGQINAQLAEFRRRGQTIELVDGMTAAKLISRAGHSAESRLAGRLLFKALSTLVHSTGHNGPPDFENCERHTLAMILSVATLIKVVLAIRPSSSACEKLLDKCPTFLTSVHRNAGASSMFKMLGSGGSSSKHKIQLKEHQFLLQQVLLTVHCYVCRKAIWGVNPSAFFCQNCDVIIHKNCTSQLTDHCWPSQQQQKSKQVQIGGGAKPISQRQTTSSVSLLARPTGASSIQPHHLHLHQSHQPPAQHRDSSVYAHSLGAESLWSASNLLPQRVAPPRHKRSSPKSSFSLTPPLGRSLHSTSASAIAMAGSKEGSSIDKHGNDLIPPYEHIDAEHGVGPVHSLRHPHMESLDSGSSPPSSTQMLPPPVFSTKFERIFPPDLPPPQPPPNIPSAPQTAPPIEQHNEAMAISAPVKVQPIRSDSGVSTEAGTTTTTNTGPAVSVSQQQVPRSQSIKKKAEAAIQLKRGGGGGSLGAADELHSHLTPPGTTHRTSSAQDLQQSITPLSGIATTSSSPYAGSDNEEETRRLIEHVQHSDVDWGSDLELDNEVPSLESQVNWEILKHLKPKEKKRQEVINELVHTERTHLRKLKVLYKIFYRPMVIKKVCSTNLIRLLFGNLEELLAVHSEMCKKMKALRREDGLYGEIGEMMEQIFAGICGDRLMRATALFCQNQQHALDALRLRYNRSKEDPFSQFLAEAENSPLCQKLQLKDMIPGEMQRLVKYPLLLETVAKYTLDPSEELQRLLNGVQAAKNILSDVNSAKRNAENIKRMDELQKQLDLCGPTEKTFFQKFDFRMHKLIYEGPLTWRQARGKTQELHVVLLEHLLVFLTKESANLQLKIHEAGTIPIMRLSYVGVEEKTGDKRAFNLLYKCDLRLFELVATTATERKTWFRLIENQVEVSRLSAVPAELFLDGILPVAVSPAAPPLASIGLQTPQSQRAHAADTEGGGLQMANIEEHVHVLTHQGLVNAEISRKNGTCRLVEGEDILTSHNLNEIVIQKPTVMENQPVLTVSERLRKSDRMIFTALAEKHQILVELMSDENTTVSPDAVADELTGLSVQELKMRTPKELAMSAMVQGNRLLECINKGMSLRQSDDPNARPQLEEVEKPSVACHKLTFIAAPLMNHLKSLMQLISDQESEINALRQQIQRFKELESSKSRKTASEETLTFGFDAGAQHTIIKSVPTANSSAEVAPPPPPNSHPPEA